MFKKFFLVFLLFFYYFSVQVYASDEIFEDVNTEAYFMSDINDMINFIEVSNLIDNTSSTIIPNQLMAESKNGSLRQVSSNIIVNVDRLTNFNTNSKTIDLVIGDARAVTEAEFEELCRIVQSEAGNQDMIGKILVANVIFNRIDSPKFAANTIHGVIFAPGQFQPVSNGRFYTCKISDETRAAVRQALNGVDYSKGATFFMARKASDRGAVSWFDTSLTYLFKHGGHEFFK